MTRIDLAENPLRIIRGKEEQQTFANKLGVHISTLYLTECGCYWPVPSTILSALQKKFGIDTTQFKKDYRAWIKQHRKQTSEQYPWDSIKFEVVLSKIAPFEQMRTQLDLSRSRIAKLLCVQPAILYRLERGDFRSLPSAVELALSEVGVTGKVLAELNELTEEYYFRK